MTVDELIGELQKHKADLVDNGVQDPGKAPVLIQHMNGKHYPILDTYPIEAPSLACLVTMWDPSKEPPTLTPEEHKKGLESLLNDLDEGPSKKGVLKIVR